MRILNGSELAFMQFADDQAVRGFDCMMTGREPRKRTGETLVTRGLMTRVRAVVIGDDGWAKEPERWRVGYALTPAGKTALTNAEARPW